MIRTLAHRGPDGCGVHLAGPVGLAHSRLSIVDLAGGHQPLCNEDGRIWVAFNGEIFNHIELRADLERAGHRFATHSDTEVLVHLYEEHGLDFVQHLNGQFALALWDGRQQQLILARDRVGIRPLFYAQVASAQGMRWVWASEVKALMALPDVPRRLDLRAVNELFTYWAPLPGHSVFEGIQSLPAGHLMVVTRQGQRLQPYWDWGDSIAADAAQGRGAGEALTLQDAMQQARHALSESVRLQLRADVPVGAYLSGGLDSAIIAALVQAHAPDRLRTFSLTFEDAEFDESAHQHTMAAHLGTAHSAVRCTRADIARLFPQAIWQAESPVVRTAPAPMLMLAQHVRESGYKVVLTGEGADEVFAGYDLFREARVRRFMARQPQSKVRMQLLDRLYPYLKHSPAASRAMAHGFFAQGAQHLGEAGFGHIPRWTTTQRISLVYSEAMRDAVGPWHPLQAIQAGLPERFLQWDALNQDQYVEARTLMTGYLLSSQGDRMAMGASIEGRFPFLDHHVIEWANRLPLRYKLMGLDEKYILKRAFADVLPPSIVGRSKQPYRAPDSASFFQDGQLVDYAAELLNPFALKQAGYFEPASVAKLVAKCQAGRAIGFGDNMAFVGVLSTMLLHHQFIEGKGMPQQGG